MADSTLRDTDSLTELAHLEGTVRMSFMGADIERAADWTVPVVILEIVHDRVDPATLHAWLEIDVRAELAAAGHGTCALATDDLNCQLWVTGALFAEKISLALEAASQVREVRWIGSLTAESVQVDLGLTPVAGMSARDTVFAGAVHQNTGFRIEWLATMSECCCLPWLEDHLQSTCAGVRSGDYWDCVAAGVRDQWYGSYVPTASLPELEAMLDRQ